MADNKQFGSPKVTGKQPGDGGHCAQCEAMLADALDGALTAADQAVFDSHMSHCGPCSQMLADARRGAAWLEMLRDPRPEPSAQLLEKILAQTSGIQTSGIHGPASQPVLQELPGNTLLPAPVYITPGAAPAYAKVLPFRARFASVVRGSSFVLHPRLAMTAAMAFFSIALTMSLTGVRLQDLHASDLSPANLQRVYYSANTHVVQYYEGLRVVYELESRVHDLESTSDTDAPAGSATGSQSDSPADTQTLAPGTDQPSTDQPSAPPAVDPAAPVDPQAAPQPGNTEPARKRPAPNPGTSRREGLNQPRHLVAANSNRKSFRNIIHARVERTLA